MPHFFVQNIDSCVEIIYNKPKLFLLLIHLHTK